MRGFRSSFLAPSFSASFSATMGVATCTGFPSGNRTPASSPERLVEALVWPLGSSDPCPVSVLLTLRLPRAWGSSACRGTSSEGLAEMLPPCRELEVGKGPEMELR